MSEEQKPRKTQSKKGLHPPWHYELTRIERRMKQTMR